MVSPDIRARLRESRHALRTPLNGILGFANLLQQDASEQGCEAFAHDLGLIVAEGNRLLEHVNTLLAEGRLDTVPAVDLATIVVDFQRAVAPALPALQAALDGLLTQAAAGGVAAMPSLPADLELIKGCVEQFAALVDDLAREPVSRCVPVSESVARPAVAPAAARRGPADDMVGTVASILVVEDDARSRELLSRQLTRMGHTVAEAEHGASALQHMQQTPFDLVLLDLSMPEMNGFQLLSTMKADPVLQRIPVIVVSGHEDMESVTRCLKLGAIDHLSKPIDSVLLRVRVRAALALASLDEGTAVRRRSLFSRSRWRQVNPAAGATPVLADAIGPEVARVGALGFLRSLLVWARPYRKPVAIFGLGLVASMAISAALPLGLKYLTDLALIPRDLTALVVILAILAGAELLTAAMDMGRDYFFARFTAKLLNDIRFSLFKHLQQLSLGFFGRVSPGEVLGRFTSDLEAVDSAVSNFLSSVLCQAVLVPVSLALVFALEWRLALISTLGLVVSVLVERRLEPPAEDSTHRMKEQQALIATVLQENVQAQPVIKMFRLQGLVIERFKHQMLTFYRTAARACFLGFLTFRVPNRAASLFGLVTLAVGALMVYDGSLTVGTLVAFQMLQGTVIGSVSELTWGLPQLLKAGVGLSRIEWLLAQKPDVVDAAECVRLPRPSKQIALHEVRFGYSDRPILDGVSLTIPMGHSVLLVGPSGCGKSTVLNLLMRFYDPLQGRVAIDGLDVRTVAQNALRTHMSVVLQESFLFNTTIRENILLGNREASDEEIHAAAKLAEIHDDIMQMPEQYRTVVGERGGRLSGGQRQRIAIARAIISNPAILLLDEATSALDPPTAASVGRTLQQVGKGRTVVSATHRFDAAPAADCIFVLRAGRLVEQGRHEELLAAGGLYSELWRQQTAGAEA